MRYKQYELDPFQIEAYKSLDKRRSVIVSAATGTGKTLIADFVISKYVPSGSKVVYTSPIKALSNQKYRDFSAEYGKDKVGLLTGDIQINPDAPLVIMTTEIYRNMLLANDPWVLDVTYVIFDEVHYVSDFERGAIWEESIIFSPPEVRFLCLSATIPNAREFADWIESVQKHRVDVVEWHKRAVPLEHLAFDTDLGVTTMDRLLDSAGHAPRKKRRRGKRRKNWKGADYFPPYHVDLIEDLEESDRLPALVFEFSRKGCLEKGTELANVKDLSSNEGRAMAAELIKQHIPEQVMDLPTVEAVRNALMRGIGIHHAGLFPPIKEVVEKLFAAGHIKVLYATETFALGVNMPARSVVFTGLRKFDGRGIRPLMSKEYYQCAGRAGRRGIDEIGYAITLVDRRSSDQVVLAELLGKDPEPIISQYALSYNTVLNLVDKHKPAEREKLLRSSFDYYIRKREKRHMWVMRRYKAYLKTLESLGYIIGDHITAKGQFATRIYFQELEVSEIFTTDVHTQLDDVELCVLLAALVYEERRGQHFKFDHKKEIYRHILDVIDSNEVLVHSVNFMSLKRLSFMIRMWMEGCEFEKLCETTSLQEGDIIRFFRMLIDLLNQIHRAAGEGPIAQRTRVLRSYIDRDVVRIVF